MRANGKLAAAPGDGAPAYEDPALIKKMRNQHSKPGHTMPVRAHYGCGTAAACPFPGFSKIRKKI
eukprot:scaffold94660_cov68-Phaeocystis_antarctica.AAC.1